jgi:HEAT repeat protein
MRMHMHTNNVIRLLIVLHARVVRKRRFSIKRGGESPDDRIWGILLFRPFRVPTIESLLMRYVPSTALGLAIVIFGTTRMQAASPAAAAILPLAQKLRDPCPAVRQAAVLALRDLVPDSKAAVPELAVVLCDSDRYVAVDAAGTLSKMGSDAACAVVPMLSNCDPRVRELAAYTLRQIGPDAAPAVSALARQLQDPCPTVRQSAVFALQEIGPAAGKPAAVALAEAMRDSDHYIAVDAGHTIEAHGVEAIPIIVPVLDDRNPLARELAIRTLAKIGVNSTGTSSSGP